MLRLMLRCSVEHVACVVGQLHHAVVVFGREVHEVEIARVNGCAFEVNLIVEVRTRRFARIAHQGDDVASNDTLTLTHEAENRSLFAQGALAAAAFLQGKKPGLYDLRDIVG